jgi:hypothetical protein
VGARRLEDRANAAPVVVIHGARRVVDRCADCGEIRPLGARRLCLGKCYDRNHRNGTLHEFPTMAQIMLARFTELRAAGLRLADIAVILDVHPRTAQRYDTQLRRQGRATWAKPPKAPRASRRLA